MTDGRVKRDTMQSFELKDKAMGTMAEIEDRFRVRISLPMTYAWAIEPKFSWSHRPSRFKRPVSEKEIQYFEPCE